MVEQSIVRSSKQEDTRRRSVRPARWVWDSLLGTVLFLALALIIATNDSGVGQGDRIAFVFAFGFGALMLLRRSLPRTVLVLSTLGVFAYYTLDYPPVGVALPIVAALFSAAEAGLLVWSVGMSVLVFATSMLFRVLDGEVALGFLLGYDAVSNVALFAAAIALGFGVRARRMQMVQQVEILRLTEAQAARETDLRMQMERERLSRELHDTVGHTMSVISLQAGVTAEAIGHDDDAARQAVSRIRSASTQTLRDLRSIVNLLRSVEDESDSVNIQSLTEVGHLVEAAKGAGLTVDTDFAVDSSTLAAPINSAAYRVIQESITNVIRHAEAAHVSVSATTRGGLLTVTVTDDGRGASSDESRSGYGLAGMAERIRLLGGSLTTRSTVGAGFTVDAVLPVRLP